MSAHAWVTLATSDSYCLGALVLAHSLRRVQSVHPSVILITPGVTEVMRERLRPVFAEVIVVDVLDSEDAAHLALLARPELGVTFTKLHCWTLTQYEKCVFLDADTLVLQNCDELFDREELSAAPDVGWPDCFNSGVFVYRPSQETFQALLQQARGSGSFDGGDQGLLNTFFSSWAHGDISKHLPFLYNIASTAFYSYLPALKQFGKDAKIMHFIGNAKPWLQNFNWERRNVCSEGHLQPALQLWWDIFCSNVHANLDVAMAPSEVLDFQIEEDVAEGRYSVPVDPDSPFPWHKPSTPKTTERQAVVLESLAEFHDPWENYKGQIDTPNTNIYNNIEQHNDNPNTQTYYRNRQESTHSDTVESYQDYTRFTPVNYEDKNTDYANYREDKHTTSNDNFKDKRNEYVEIKQNSDFDNYSAPEQHHSYCNIPNEQTEYYHKEHIPHSQHIDKSHIHTENTYPNINDESDIVVDYKEGDVDSDSYIQHTDTASQYDEDTYMEEIKPRHPYDNFYLLHVPIFDKHGCKHCSCTYVEVPPTPPRTPSPFLQTPAILQVHDQQADQQAGIAGTFSRITLGEEGQREVIDESQRRQGWEAGNADYMGADSFDNIWAKISQTLTGASVPQPSEPTLAVVPPSEPVIVPEPVSVPEPVLVPEPVSAPEPVSGSELASVPEPVLAPEPAPVPESSLASELASATELLTAPAPTVESAATPVLSKEPSPPVETSCCILPPREAPVPADAPSCPLPKTEDKPQPKSETDQPPDEQQPQNEETQEKKSTPKKKFVCHLKRPAPQPDALLTPDSELEDAASIAQSIIASETGLTTPLVISATPPIVPIDDAAPQCEKGLCVDMSIQETPPVRSELVSLAQIGIVPAKSSGETQSIVEETEQESVEKSSKAEEQKPASIIKIEHEPVVIPKKAEDPASELTQPLKSEIACKIETETTAAKESLIGVSGAEVTKKEKSGTQLQPETHVEAKWTAVQDKVIVEEKTEDTKSGSTGENVKTQSQSETLAEAKITEGQEKLIVEVKTEDAKSGSTEEKAKTLPKSEKTAEKSSECKIEAKMAAAQEPVKIQKKAEDAKIEIASKDIEIKTIASKEPLPKKVEPAKDQTEIPPKVEQSVVETSACPMKPKTEPESDKAIKVPEEKSEDPKLKKASPKKSPKPAKLPEQSSAAKSASAEAPVPPPRKKEKKPKK